MLLSAACRHLVTEAGKGIFELRRIENEPSIRAIVPLISSWRWFQVKNKVIFNIQLSTAALLEKKMGDASYLQLTFGSKTNNREVADCTAASLTAFWWKRKKWRMSSF